jgi:hypothetical protein
LRADALPSLSLSLESETGKSFGLCCKLPFLRKLDKLATEFIRSVLRL